MDAVRRAGRQRPALSALLGGNGDGDGKDLRLPSDHLRARPEVRFSQVHHRGAERRHSRRGDAQHRDDGRAPERAVQQPPVRALAVRCPAGEPAPPVRHQHHAAAPRHQHRRLSQELRRHRRREEGKRHLQGDGALDGRTRAHRVRAGGASHRHHRRTAERRRDRPRAGGHQGAEPALHPALLGHSSEPVQRRLPARPGARVRAETRQADRRGQCGGRKRGQRAVRSRGEGRLQAGYQGQIAHSRAGSRWSAREGGDGQARLRPVQAVE